MAAAEMLMREMRRLESEILRLRSEKIAAEKLAEFYRLERDQYRRRLVRLLEPSPQRTPLANQLAGSLALALEGGQ